MVLFQKNTHTFKHDFETATLAYFNRYPNPFASHVLSTDTIEKFIDEQGKLHQTKLIWKTGRLPKWVKPFLGKISRSLIIEKSIVDPVNKTMKTYTSNLDHTSIIRIEEFTKYQYDSDENVTKSTCTVKFSSGFKGFGVKDRIEKWSYSKFAENLSRSREGLKFVMDGLRERLNPANRLPLPN
ncbi:unnamed protein product [[Candida] boidinii]|uniref:Unnamed protein product n=1 Tax=Candida boidinii TaxID=5477 RepID=A0A9W6T5Y7_CANBO|nr:hypothetical protein BVG19_g5139 [[Candida] boidinii]OWB53444.1 hypothetical protein B5S27_g5040 [[Candida] boidinii]OWB68800.1 hypothetical protein B5S30_g4190 [[Candida] boidinii]OWB85681.1 hypothetical protein B5S33_g4350 [[Candida] boidinii]GME76666.1 unnamed protein product [[Candida] boidinii]